MSEYHELQREAAEARVGADRMAMGLSCIPDPLRGDMVEIERLKEVTLRLQVEIDWLREVIKNTKLGSR